MGNYIVRSGFFGEASMRQTGRRYRGSTPYNGARVQKFRRVQSGSVIHHNIASRQSRTTAFLFFSCSLQEAAANRAGKSHRSIVVQSSPTASFPPSPPSPPDWGYPEDGYSSAVGRAVA